MVTLGLAAGYAAIFKVAGIGVVSSFADMLVDNEKAKFAIRVATTVACGYIAWTFIDSFFSALVGFGRGMGL